VSVTGRRLSFCRSLEAELRGLLQYPFVRWGAAKKPESILLCSGVDMGRVGAEGENFHSGQEGEWEGNWR